MKCIFSLRNVINILIKTIIDTSLNNLTVEKSKTAKTVYFSNHLFLTYRLSYIKRPEKIYYCSIFCFLVK